MKKTVITAVLLLFCAVSSYAQRQNFMYPDNAVMELYDSVKFVNQQFHPGILVSESGKLSGGTMNISTVDQKIHFIGPDNDTLVIKDNQAVERAYILGKAYVNSKYGFMEELESVGDVTLCELKATEFHTDAAPGAYGLKNQTSATKALTYAEWGLSLLLHLDINADKAFSYSKKPFLFVDGKAYPVTQKTLVKHFPEHKEFIEQYFKENNVTLTSVAPMRELFCMLKLILYVGPQIV